MRFEITSFLAVVFLPYLSFALSFPADSPIAKGDDLPYHLRGRRSFVERDGVKRTIYEHEATGAKLDYVTNSGICETTPGVNQYSGYLSTGSNDFIWFWFFEARNSPNTAPLATWFNGGPGCSSMIGLFIENGPCHFVNNSTEPSLNPYSFNEYANMLYIDQPFGAGFSYGDDPVNSTVNAAPYVWKFLQAFYAQFPQYENHDFGIFTESYGGHYAPEFATYFESQNEGITKGNVTGQIIPIVAIGINNGYYDPIIQQKSYVDFSHNNTYRQIINDTQYTSYLSDYYNKCLPYLKLCNETTGDDVACEQASSKCFYSVQGPISSGVDFDIYDVRQPYDDPFPPEQYFSYLLDSDVKKAIGATTYYAECGFEAHEQFAATGDDARSFLPTLSGVVQSGITVLIWAGDADWICNWFGNFDVVNAISYNGSSEFNAKAVENYTVNGTVGGTFKTVDNLSWLRVFKAGHLVMYYQPELALQVFKQTMQKKAITST